MFRRTELSVPPEHHLYSLKRLRLPVRIKPPSEGSPFGPCVREGGGGYSHTLPIRVCAAQRGRDFEAPDLERGIHFTGVF